MPNKCGNDGVGEQPALPVDNFEKEAVVEWTKAIIKVLEASPEPRHYVDIAKEIAAKNYREFTELGATPASTVAVVIGSSLGSGPIKRIPARLVF